MEETKMIWFDMDGTLADTYAVEGWLDDIKRSSCRLFREAKPRMNLSHLARLINMVAAKGYYSFGVISWTPEGASSEYEEAAAAEKIKWLNKHLPSVKWEEIKIVKYGTPKSEFGNGLLFDDDEKVREDWNKRKDNFALDAEVETIMQWLAFFKF